MTPDLDCGNDAAAYVLGAMDEAEVAAFRRHLETCAVCQDEVDALEGAVEALPMMVPQFQPPGTLRQRVMADVREDLKAHQRKPTLTLRQRLAKPVPRPALAGFMALAVAGIITVVLGFRPAGTHVVRAQIAWAPGAAVVKISSGHGELLIEGMPEPPAGKVYEVWVKHDTGAVSPTTALFAPTSAGEAAVDVPGSLSGVSAVMVTAERDGGSTVPHLPPVLVANLS
jgi:anti-sigma factor RsiW